MMKLLHPKAHALLVQSWLTSLSKPNESQLEPSSRSVWSACYIKVLRQLMIIRLVPKTSKLTFES